MFTAFLIIQVVIAGQLYLLPFYFTNQFGMEAFLCGLLMLVSPLVTAILSVPFGRWSDTHGRIPISGCRMARTAETAVRIIQDIKED